ncbi:MAG: TonB-dependent receptor, partial [Acidobacteria bacterium]|nr:TonB-dependent receptor [Acidobacteriota bacterium]
MSQLRQILILCLAAAPLMFAQAHRAIILGQVRDSTGAPVPNAAVRVVEVSTNAARTTATNEAGNYEVPGLLPGDYRVEASMSGFKTAAVGGLNVTSGRRVEVNLTIEVGDVTESITVQSARQLLDTASADVNTVVDKRKIADLPVGQGNATYFFFFAAGADSASAAARGTSVGNDVQPMQRAGTGLTRFNGSPTGTAEFTVDGAPNTQRGNGGAGGAVAFNPSPDMLQEVRVQAATFDASVGHTGGATIDMVLKSGANQYHGTASKYWRSKEWNANTWSGNRGGIARTDFEFQLWGATFGGPVNIPRLYRGKDRTFFFVGWEKWGSLSPNPPSFVTIPRPQHLRGDLSDLLRLGAQYQLYDPDSAQAVANGRIQRAPIPNNVIPASRINPTAAAFAKLWPEPNTQGTADGQLNFAYVNEPLPRQLWALPIRIDHNLSDRQKLFGRLVASNTYLPRSGVFTRTDISLWSIDSDHRELALGDVWTISPTLIADFRGSVMRFPWNTAPYGTEVDYKAYGLEKVASLINTRLAGFPGVTVGGYSSFAPVQGSRQVSEIRTGAAHFTHIRGNHSLKFGADVRWYIDNRGRDDVFRLDFGGAYSRGPLDNSPAAPIGNGLADFLLGRFGSANINQPSKAANLATYQGLYLQDDWKITPKLMVNLGLRWEREGPATERFNRNLAGFDSAPVNPISDAARANYARQPAIAELPLDQFRVLGGLQFAGVGGQPRTIFDASNRNFAPRVGLAYQLRPSTVIRAGYGIYFIPYGQRFIANEGGVPGFDVNTQSFSTTNSGITFTRTVDNLFPTGLDSPIGSSQGLRTFLGQGLTIPAPRQNPYAYNQRWQFGLQQRFRGSYRAEARYVGNRTIRMPNQRNFNSLPNRYLSTAPERDQTRIDYLSSRIPNPFLQVPGVTGTIGTNQFSSPDSLLRPYPHFAAITVQVPEGYTTYHSLQVDLEKQLANGFTFQTGYVFSKTIDALSYLNAGDPAPERVISANHKPHIWRLMALWEVPLARKHRWLGGWQVQALSFGQSGTPIDFGNVLFRGDIKQLPVPDKTPDRMFNVDAGFERTAARQLASNVRRFPSRLASVTTDRAWNTDFSILKNTIIREGVTAQFRAEAYNVFNQHFFQGGVIADPVNR